MVYSFTLNDRLYLEVALQAERGGEDDVQELRGELFDKIRVSEEERAEYMRTVPGGALVDKTAPELTVEFDKHEARKLKALVIAWKKQSASVNDREALGSLLDKLTATAAAHA